jgi:hypothetical protein
MESQYKVLVTSTLFYISRVLVSLVLAGLVLSSLKLDLGLIEFMSVFLGLSLFFWFISRRLGKAEVILSIDNDGLKVRWIKSFIFKENGSKEYKWGDLKSYRLEEHTFDRLRILSTTGEIFKLTHNPLDEKKDDYRRFVNEFTTQAKERNIDLDKNFHQTKVGLIVTILSTVILFITIGLMIFGEGKNSLTNWILIIAFGTTLLFQIIKTFSSWLNENV